MKTQLLSLAVLIFLTACHSAKPIVPSGENVVAVQATPEIQQVDPVYLAGASPVTNTPLPNGTPQPTNTQTPTSEPIINLGDVIKDPGSRTPEPTVTQRPTITPVPNVTVVDAPYEPVKEEAYIEVTMGFGRDAGANIYAGPGYDYPIVGFILMDDKTHRIIGVGPLPGQHYFRIKEGWVRTLIVKAIDKDGNMLGIGQPVGKEH